MDIKIVEMLADRHFQKLGELFGGRVEPIPLDQVINLVYRFSRIEGEAILRLTLESHHDELDIIAELDFVQFLFDHGVQVCPPIASRNGRFTEIIEIGGSRCIACLFEKAPGGPIDYAAVMKGDNHLVGQWGRLVGSMHSLTGRYQPDHLPKHRPAWNSREIMLQAQQYLPTNYAYLYHKIEQLVANIDTLPKESETYGLIHNDLNPTNFFVDQDSIKLFDFDDCCYHWFIADIAVALPFYESFFREVGWEQKINRFLDTFFSGYRAFHPLRAEILTALPEYLRLMNINNVIFSFEIDPRNRRLYSSWFDRVLSIENHGHPLFSFDFDVVVQGKGFKG